jgi:hypothetical protein
MVASPHSWLASIVSPVCVESSPKARWSSSGGRPDAQLLASVVHRGEGRFSEGHQGGVVSGALVYKWDNKVFLVAIHAFLSSCWPHLTLLAGV